MRIMPGLMEMRLHVASRMREIAASTADPREIRSAEAYADELELAVINEQSGFIANDNRMRRSA
jgi:hypothetical protein